MKRSERRDLSASAMIRMPDFTVRTEVASAMFGLFIFVALLLMAGIGIDVMHCEQESVRLQGATDRAVLVASSLRQTQDVETVIRDYQARQGLEQLVDTIESDQGVNFREARVTAQGSVPTLLMHLIAINQLGLRVVSAAEERVPNQEISLLLDLSGSMNSFNWLPNLQADAQEFVETISDARGEGSVSMSLISYTGQLNAGPLILDPYNVLHRQECLTTRPLPFFGHPPPVCTADRLRPLR